MKSTSQFAGAFFLGCSLTTAVAAAYALPPARLGASTSTIYAQTLVNRAVARHPELLDVIFHVTPSGSSQNIAIAAYTDKERGQSSGDDDTGVMLSGKPVVEVQKDGVRIGILLPLDDRSGNRIGALGLMYPYHTGEPQAEFLKRANGVRAEIEKSIASRQELFRKR